MGRRGPTPLPSNIKRLKGTYRADRAAPNEPEPEVSIPTPPKWLRQTDWGLGAANVWNYLAPRLAELDLITEVDKYRLAIYCDAVARVAHWRREIKKHGPVQVTETGYRAQNPEMGYLSQAIKDEAKYGSLFGLSPADRTRISVEKKDEPTSNRFAAFG